MNVRLIKNLDMYDYAIVDSNDSIIDTSMGQLSNGNCDEMFRVTCNNCQNGCPVCNGYGWVVEPSNEVNVQIVMEPYYDGKFIDDGNTHSINPKFRPELDIDGNLILKRI